MQNPFLVVIPAYNEADTIEELATRGLRYADVCVVDDASTDDTARIVAGLEGVQCLRHEKNTHIARAILDGMRFALDRGYKFCITMDAGLSHDPDAIPEFQKRTDADLVIGFRDQRVAVPLYRRALSRAATTCMNLALKRRFVPWGGAGLRDVSSGYRMYSRDAFSLLVNAKMRSRTFDFHLEALAYVFRRGMRIEEIPITYRFSNSSLRLAVVGDAMRTCARLWFDDLR